MSSFEGNLGAAAVSPIIDSHDVVEHFTARASRYDRSSRWCSDPEMMRQLIAAAKPQPTDQMLDVACGTGLVSEAFRGWVACRTGLDLTPAMIASARPRTDRLTLGSAELAPFRNESFDLVLCRQGIQFMNAHKAVGEMVRVARPGGRVVLVDLCAHGEEREECFAILRLRNPARRNFFVPQDLANLLQSAGCRTVSTHRVISPENVDVWSGNGAISESKRERIGAIYRNASPAYRQLHAVQYRSDGTIVDHMLFAVTVGIR